MLQSHAAQHDAAVAAATAQHHHATAYGGGMQHAGGGGGQPVLRSASVHAQFSMAHPGSGSGGNGGVAGGNVVTHTTRSIHHTAATHRFEVGPPAGLATPSRPSFLQPPGGGLLGLSGLTPPTSGAARKHVQWAIPACA